MSITSRPNASNEQAIVDALITKLEDVAETRLGYSATGLDDTDTLPLILIQLESLNEIERKGLKAKYELQFNLSTVVKTSEQTTAELIQLSHQVRTALDPSEKLCPESRQHSLSDTRFDIAPSYGQLSFADSSLTVETIL